jgi:hypothetical protein
LRKSVYSGINKKKILFYIFHNLDLNNFKTLLFVMEVFKISILNILRFQNYSFVKRLLFVFLTDD